MDKLKLLLQGYADRIDALSLRERALVFLAAAAVLFLTYDTFLLEPLLKRQKSLFEATQLRQAAVTGIEQQIQAVLQRRSANSRCCRCAARRRWSWVSRSARPPPHPSLAPLQWPGAVFIVMALSWPCAALIRIFSTMSPRSRLIATSFILAPVR